MKRSSEKKESGALRSAEFCQMFETQEYQELGALPIFEFCQMCGLSEYSELGARTMHVKHFRSPYSLPPLAGNGLSEAVTRVDEHICCI